MNSKMIVKYNDQQLRVGSKIMMIWSERENLINGRGVQFEWKVTEL